LKGGKIKSLDLSLVWSDSVDSRSLLDFYGAMYPNRKHYLPTIWKWQARSSFLEKNSPLVLLHNDRIIGHLGLIPLCVSLEGKRYGATLGKDLAVLPEFQGHGLANLLLKKWMELPDVQMGYPNERAIGLYRKLGWKESSDSYLHFFLLKPFDNNRFVNSVPSFLRKITNTISFPFWTVLYHRRAFPIKEFRLREVNLDSVRGLVSSSYEQHSIVEPVHDLDYFSWRLVNSPETEKYRIFNVNDTAMAVKLVDKLHYKYVDLLCVSSESKHADMQAMISTLAIWGLRQGYSYVRYYTRNRELSDHLRRSLLSIVKRPYFIFRATDTTLTEELERSSWHLELIEGDFDNS
jgi:GNAT superfamily N-acetyltransferase